MNSIYIKNARVNNLRNVTLEIGRNQLVVVTGVSGSGKSSLAFDTLYAEGQRRYVESLSSYARQFLDRMEKPEVDYIQGLAPAIAIQQKEGASNPRSTVGTITEVYDFLKLLYARVGKTYSPVSGKQVARNSVSDVVDLILKEPRHEQALILAETQVRSKGYKAELELCLQKGFTRILENDHVRFIEEVIENPELPEVEYFYLLIDRTRLQAEDEEALRNRLADSVQTAYQEGHGRCWVQLDKDALMSFSEKFEADGIVFEAPSVNLFSFNNPYGACPACEGFGRVMGIDEDLVVPDKGLSLYEGAVAPWRGEVMNQYLEEFIVAAAEMDFPIHRPYYDLSEREKEILWSGINGAMGIRPFFTYLESKTHKIQYRVMLARYRGYTTCPECKGSRIRKDANYVKVGGYSISDLLLVEIRELARIMETLDLSDSERAIAKRLMREIQVRLDFLNRVGVGYLMLNRKVNTLSGGEMQRIRLATSLGGGLVGSMYILDEPSVGLHARDTDMLVDILLSLRNKGNTVIVVEHDESVMRRADQIVDMGPGAGELGGTVIFNGKYEELLLSDTLTGAYLSARKEIPLPTRRREIGPRITLSGARLNNLKGIDVTFPLHALTVVSGVSGSGKSTLIDKILFPLLRNRLGEQGERPGFVKELKGDLELIKSVEMVDQSPIGRSARSNPATYLKAYDPIRELYAGQPLGKLKGLKPGDFSFNVDGGRCDECQGEGYVTIEMQFLPDVKLLCDTCKGKRFKKHILEVEYKGKNIDEVLNLTLTEALAFFADLPKISSKLEVLNRVGLGYLRMGQSTATLSGGEAQRMKLASFLSQTTLSRGVFYIFDEPTTGLHFEDIARLLSAINELIELGNTVIIIEHHMDVIKCADWLIDLGPEGGDRGGNLVFQGRPEDILAVANSYTGKYLKEKLVQ